jgi:basic membrane protein A and related proteins
VRSSKKSVIQTRTLAISMLAVGGLIAASCGGDDGDTPAAGGDEEAETTTTAAAEEEETTTTAAEEEETTDTTEATAPGDVKVTILFDLGGRGDQSFNDSAGAGLDQAVEEFGIEAVESTPSGDGDRAERAIQSAENGSQLVIGVGFLWGDALTAAAEQFPDVHFAIVDSVIEAPNVASLVFAEEQGSFLVGAAAALKSTSGSVGFIGGVENDLIAKFEAGFIAGACAANPEIEYTGQYISQPPDFSGFNDTARGREIATSMYEDGVDVIYAAAGSSGLGMFEAAAEGDGRLGIGVDSDQYNLVPADQQPIVLSSMLKRVDVAVYETIAAEVNGEFAAGVQVFDLEREGVGYSTTGGAVDDIADQLDDYAAQIIAGDIEVPTAPASGCS